MYNPTYLGNLLPRLRQFTKSLNQKEFFVDKPWVYLNNSGDKIMYIFYRDGKLKIIINGRSKVGTWSYNQHANRLFVNNGEEELSLKQDFVEKGLMILKVDDFNSNPWIVLNENEVPDLDLERYLIALLIQQLNLTVFANQASGSNCYVSLNGNRDSYFDQSIQPLNTTLNFDNGETKVFVDGKLIDSFYNKKIVINSKEIVVKTKTGVLEIGNLVVSGGLENGTYKIGSLQITILNSKISAIKENNFVTQILVLIFIIIIGIIGYCLNSDYKNEQRANKIKQSFESTNHDTLVNKASLEKSKKELQR